MECAGERKIVLWVPDWPIASLAASVPPMAPAVTVRSGVVVATTRTARVYGVKRGMRQSTAQQLCEELLVLPHDPLRVDSSFEIFLRVFDQLAAGVCGLWPGLAWAPLSEGKRGKTESELMASLTEQIASQTGVEAYVGIGTGTATAVAAAKRGLCVPRQDTYDFLATLSVGELIAFLPDSEKQEYELTLRLLHTLGIRTVQHLRELGATQLVTRCGLIGQRLWTLGEGGDLFVKQTGTRIAEVHVHMDFDPPVAQASHALVGARRAAQDFVDQLERQGLQAQAVRIELLGGLIGEQAVNISGRTWSFFDTSRSAQVAERIIWQINAWQGTTHAHVGEAEGSLQGIELTALDILSHFATGTLWGSAPQLEKVSQTVARVQMLAGEESVRQPRLFGGLDPRSRTLLVPWGKEEEGDPREGEWRGAIRSAPQVLFDIPLACRVIGDDTHGAWGPVWVDRRGVLTGTPRRLVVLEGCEEISPGGYELTDFSGLWPIKGTWWSPNPAERAARCYLRIRTVQGIDVLLVHQERNWWVEGIYSSQKSLWR